MSGKTIFDTNFFDDKDNKGGDIIDHITREQLEVDKIKEETDFLRLLDHFGIKTKQTGKNTMALCPFHDDTIPSLAIFEANKRFKCFGCDKKGDVVKFVEYYKGIKFIEALKYLDDFNKDFNRRGTQRIAEVKKEVVQESSSLGVQEKEKEKDKGKKVFDMPLQQSKEKAVVKEVVQESGSLGVQEKEKEENDQGNQDQSMLLDEVVKRYYGCFLGNRGAIDYLRSRGLGDLALIGRFKVGFCDGMCLLPLLSKTQKEGLREIGILNKNGYEVFNNCVIVPIFDNFDRIVGVYGRNIDDKSKFKHLYLAGNHKSVFSRRASKVYDEVILTESIIDALSLVQLGFNNVQACYGVNGFTDEMLEILKEDRVKTVIVGFDNDNAGKKGAKKLKNRLVGEDFLVKMIFPSLSDWNEALVKGINKEEVEKLIEKAEVFKKEETHTVKMEKITGGYSFLFPDGEKYEVLNFKEDYVGPLKVILKVEAYGKMHCDDLNLYTYRSRENFTKQAEYLTGLPVDKGTRQILSIIKNLEEVRNKKLNAGDEVEKESELTKEEIKIGMNFLTNPNLFDELREDLTLIGCVGEENTKVLLYLVATSRQRVNPISVYVLGRSSGGKSWLVKTVLKLIPDNAKFIITKISPEVIYYMEKGLQNKVVMVGEFDGADNIEYILRELVSDGRVSKLVTLKDPDTGLPKPQFIISEGPISLISTSTKPEDINTENLSRCILMHIDETQEQTMRILEYQRYITSKKGYLDRLRGEEIIKKHHIVQRLLEDVMVFNIFGDELDFPTLLLLTRRAHFNFLHVIEMVAFVLQKQHTISFMETNGKQIRYIETNIHDYSITYSLMMDGVMENTLDEMGVNAKELHKIMFKMVTEIAKAEGKTIDTVYLERQKVLIKSGWTTDQIKRNIKPLIEHGYLEIVAGNSQGKRHKYRVLNVKNRIKELLEKIPTPEEMKKRLIAKGKM